MHHQHQHPTIRPYPGFNPNADAEALHKAMAGMGSNKDKIIGILCQRSNWQRQEIAAAYKVSFGKDLGDKLKSELSGDFEDLVLALMETPVRFDAHSLHKAISGIGTK
uniref:Annexin n=1 Tax=Panagrolaimus sp. ES5 TaxID=591445 RepID=A0AC34GJD0_9BILA